MRKTWIIIALLGLSAPVAAEPKFNGWKGAKPKTPCECRHQGGKVMLGARICQSINGRLVTLQCELVLNNTSWKKVADGCEVSASLAYPEAATLHARLFYRSFAQSDNVCLPLTVNRDQIGHGAS